MVKASAREPRQQHPVGRASARVTVKPCRPTRHRRRHVALDGAGLLSGVTSVAPAQSAAEHSREAGAFMALANRKPPPSMTGLPCSIGVLLATLQGDELDAFLEMLGTPERRGWPATAI